MHLLAMRTVGRRTLAVAAAALLITACGERAIDWNAPENFVAREKSSKVDDKVKLEYDSLVDATAQSVYGALSDVEHFADFIPGVDNVQLLSVDGNTKTVQIAQRVIGRQSNAKVEWTFHPDQLRIEFKTLVSNLSNNDGSYEITASPDGKRCLVHSTFLVAEPTGSAAPIGVLASGTREAFLAAARGVKARATGAKK
jgi:carbon monoxide dehydrogenase subunit G